MRYVVGIDGGGSGTRALLATVDGRIVAEGRGGPANFQVVGAENARASLEAALSAALHGASAGPVAPEQVAAVAVGLAGIHTRADYERFAVILREVLPGARVSIYNDGEIALSAATGGRAGVVVIGGTGSIAYGADHAGRLLRCGGWGPIIGDEGSAYTIARRALRAASCAADGRAPYSTLVDAFIAALDVPTFDDMVRWVYGPPAMTRHELAALAPLVARCAAEGDEAARTILAGAGEELAVLAVSLARRLDLCGGVFTVACSGGVWRAGELVSDPFRQHLLEACPGAVIGPPLLIPAAGAVLLAIRSLSPDGAPDQNVADNLSLTHRYQVG